MFNVTGSEIIILLLLALVVLGPEKLPDAIRRFGKVYGELRRMSQGFQDELRDVLDEPMRELRSTADMARRAIEDPVDEVSQTAKGVGKAATDAFAAATRFSAAPVIGGSKAATPPGDEGSDVDEAAAAGTHEIDQAYDADGVLVSGAERAEADEPTVESADEPTAESAGDVAVDPRDDPAVGDTDEVVDLSANVTAGGEFVVADDQAVDLVDIPDDPVPAAHDEPAAPVAELEDAGSPSPVLDDGAAPAVDTAADVEESPRA